ncbi:MAG: sigma-70 family RNA polymerase sigma factor [Lachnospiraceae bacterium]|nr:sigma-70 family RNA polymerase sigma factor [Lachnospiraceae bacterium]
MKLSDSALNDYEGVSDEELIIRLREGEEKIQDHILDKYKNLVKSKAKSMYILGAEPEDLIQEGMIGLFKAIRDYDAGRDASFYTFADLCISRQVYTAVTASGRKKHTPLNNYISLYSEEDPETGVRSLEDILSVMDYEPESMLIDKENVEIIENLIDTRLSDLEKQVMELHLTGMGYTDIARVLGKDEKSTDNALSRAKAKIKKCLTDFKREE